MLILASRSHIRQMLLTQAGVTFAAETSPYDEEAHHNDFLAIPAQQQSRLLATGKAMTLSPHRPGAIVIGCDQTLEFDGTTLHKCRDMNHARRTLQQLRGKTHNLNSSIVAVQDDRILFDYTSTVRMTMRDFSNDFLDTYLIQTGPDILHSVGCYQFEGLGAQLFSKTDGDYHAILGLPLLPLLAFLREIGELKI